MLTEIRDRSSGVFAWVIATLIIIPMAFWGVQEYASTEAQPTIIEIGGQKITQQGFQIQLANAQARAADENPSLANSDIFSSDFYKRQVLDGMIDRAVAEDVAVQHNYQIGDKQLVSLIKQSPIFQIDGEFDKSAYEAYAASQGYSKTQFEQNTRANTRISQVASGYTESALVLPDEIRSLLEIQSEQRSFDLIKINKTDFIEGIEVSEADIAVNYSENQDLYMEADRISIRYVEISLDEISENMTVNSDDVRAIYDDSVESYISPETREISHILLSTTSGEDDDAQAAKALELVDQLNSGADFAELALANSQDPGSKNTGGSLGEIAIGAMVPEFEDAAFSLAEGVISQPVKSQFGYHIVRVDKILGGVAQSFDDVKFDIEQEERDRKTEEELLLRVEQLRNVVFEQPESLEGAASELSLEVRETELFSRDSGQGIASNDSIRAAAFSELVSVDGLNSEPIELAGGVYVALRKLSFSASAPKALEAVSAQIKSSLSDARASAAAKQVGDSVLQKAALDWSELSNDESLEIASHTISMIANNDNVAPDVLREVLKIQLEGAATKVESFTGSNGDFNIVRLNKIAPGNVAAISEQIKESTRQLIAQRNGSSLFQSYIKGLSEDLNGQINEDLL
ncbi:MAG: peptidyl-prolyl cis-trans isomerase D [Cryomorphaceae bacterium]|jgi:peptidyl-prolyl cis-trans isomerase D